MPALASLFHINLSHDSMSTTLLPAKRTVNIITDGGTSCNIPALGYGIGYGSYKVDDLPVIRVDHKRPMSANAAEIWTVVAATEALVDDFSIVLPQTVLHVTCDSRIVVKWCSPVHYQSDHSGGGSDEFRDAVAALKHSLRKFHSASADWWARENSVRIFGH